MTRLAKTLVLVAIALAPFALARLALFVAYPEDFGSLSAPTVAEAFLNGVRFDLFVLLPLIGVPLLLMNLPVRRFGKRWFDAWAWLAFVPLTPLALLLGGNVVYYGHVRRHLADELLMVAGDADFLVGEAVSNHLPALVGVMVGLALLAGVWGWVLARELRASRRPLGALVAIAAAGALGIRGTVDSKPLGLIDAYRSGNAAFGNLSLNGVFSAYHAARDREKVGNQRFFDDSVAYAELGLGDGPYPLLRRSAARRPTGLNLVILMLESWDVHYMDSYSGGRLGATPNFDALAAGGLKFENCFAASQRSVEGFQAMLTGVPPVVGVPGLGWGLELAHLTRLGTVARQHGYRTLFGTSSKRRSYRLDSAAKSLGFEQVFGREDVPVRLDYPQKVPKWGWDYETLQFAIERMDEFDSPFLTFVFTGSTHTPYPDPGRRFWLREHTTSGEDGFVNVLHYSDWALGEFFAAARTRPWFDRTVFVVASDHVFRKAPREHGLPADFRVPFVIYAPGRIEPRVDTRVCSHLDGLPTFFELLGFADGYAAFGRSLLGTEEGFALVRKGSVMGIIAERGSMSHTLEFRVDASADGGEPPGAEYFERLERRLLASVQVTGQLLRANRWAPPSGREGAGPAVEATARR